MFQGTLEGEHTPTFFTRDTEHLIEKLSDKDRQEAIEKGWITVTSVPTMADLREKAKGAKAAEKERIAKGGKK
jgi:ribosomal protein L12E/L44/L45/RPP1/RPP2